MRRENGVNITSAKHESVKGGVHQTGVYGEESLSWEVSGGGDQGLKASQGQGPGVMEGGLDLEGDRFGG